MLNTEELLELEDSIKEELEDHLLEVLTRLNRTEQLEDLLQLLGMEYLLEKDSGYQRIFEYPDKIAAKVGECNAGV